MADNTDIEAKLCSYVEGDLDAAGRAQIEQYLQTNPQYRSVVDDLIRARGELRALPRMNAPQELQEAVAGQLERSALLRNDDLMRTVGKQRFPHWRAWAAVIVLAAGMGLVIYAVLPARNAKMAELEALRTGPVIEGSGTPKPALATTTSTPQAVAGEPGTGGFDEHAASALDRSQIAPSTTQASVADSALIPAPSTQAALAMMQSPAAAPPMTAGQQMGEAMAAASAATTNRSEVGESISARLARLKETTSSAELNEVASFDQMITIHTSDPHALESELEAYLRDNNFAFAAAPASTTQAAATAPFAAGTADSFAGHRSRKITVTDITERQARQIIDRFAPETAGALSEAAVKAGADASLIPPPLISGAALPSATPSATPSAKPSVAASTFGLGHQPTATTQPTKISRSITPSPLAMQAGRVMSATQPLASTTQPNLPATQPSILSANNAATRPTLSPASPPTSPTPEPLGDLTIVLSAQPPPHPPTTIPTTTPTAAAASPRNTSSIARAGVSLGSAPIPTTTSSFQQSASATPRVPALPRPAVGNAATKP